MAIPAIIAAALRAVGSVGTRATAGQSIAGVGRGTTASGGGMGALFKDASEKADKLGGSTKKMGDQFKELNAQIAYGNVNMHQFASIVGAVPGQLVKMGTGFADILKSMSQPFSDLVAGHSPGVTRQLDIAFRDLYGVMGRALVPVVQAFTPLVRKLGDTFAGMEPVIAPAVRAVSFFIDKVGGRWIEGLQKRAGMLEMVVTVFERITTAAAYVVTAGMDLIDFVLKPMFRLASAFGFGGNSFNKDATSLGAGMRPVKASAAKDISDEAIKNALILGQSPKQTPTEGYLSEIQRIADDILTWLRENKPPTSAREAGGQLASGKGLLAAGAARVSPAYGMYRLAR